MSEEEAPSTEEIIEEAAIKGGWRPDGKDAEGNSLTALEFVINGSRFHRSLKETVDELKEDSKRAYKIIAEHITTSKKEKFDDKRQSLEEKIAQAKEDGDVETVEALSEQKGSLKEPEELDDPEVGVIDAWVQKQPWWDNPRMQKDAIAFYNAEAYASSEEDPAKILEVVEERIKEVHKSYFEPKNPNRDKGAGDAGNPKTTASDELDMNDLDEDERKHIDQFRGMGLDEKKLMESVKNLRAQRAI